MPMLRALPGPVAGASADAFPGAAQLAALGPVLCLYRTPSSTPSLVSGFRSGFAIAV